MYAFSDGEEVDRVLTFSSADYTLTYKRIDLYPGPEGCLGSISQKFCFKAVRDTQDLGDSLQVQT